VFSYCSLALGTPCSLSLLTISTGQRHTFSKSNFYVFFFWKVVSMRREHGVPTVTIEMFLKSNFRNTAKNVLLDLGALNRWELSVWAEIHL
jgi:hypothetical protein